MEFHSELGLATMTPSVAVDEYRFSLPGFGADYGSKQVVYDIDLDVGPAQIVVILGHNGARNPTTLSAALCILPTKTAEIFIDGKKASGLSPRQRVECGMGYVPADNFVFSELIDAENLVQEGLTESESRVRKEPLVCLLDTWMILAERTNQLTCVMPAGQRRMLRLSIALMSCQSLLLLDEPSLGLAPNIVDQLFADLRSLADNGGLSVLLIEQGVAKALAIADGAYIMRSAHVTAHEPAGMLANHESLWELCS